MNKMFSNAWSFLGSADSSLISQQDMTPLPLNVANKKVGSVASLIINREKFSEQRNESLTDDELSISSLSNNSTHSNNSEISSITSPPATPPKSIHLSNFPSSNEVVPYQHQTNSSEHFTQENFPSNYAYLMSQAKAILDLNKLGLIENTINLARNLMTNVQNLNNANEGLLSILGEIQKYYSEKHAPNANNNILYSRQNLNTTAAQLLEKFNFQKDQAQKSRAYLSKNKVSLQNYQQLNSVITHSESAYDLLEKHLLSHGESLVQQMDFIEKLNKNNTHSNNISIEEIETIISICDNYQKLESYPNTYKAQEKRQLHTSNEYSTFEKIWENNHYAFDLLVHRKVMVESKLESALTDLHQLIQKNKQSAENLKQSASRAPSVSPINFSEIFTLQNIPQFIWKGFDLNTPMTQNNEHDLEMTQKNNEIYDQILKQVPEIDNEGLKVKIRALKRDISDTNKTIEDIEKNRWMTNASQKFSVIAKGMSSGLLFGGSIVFTVLGTARIASLAERMLFRSWR